MSEVRFLTVVGEDRVIRLPAGMAPPEGEVEVILRSTIDASPAVAQPSTEEEDIDSLRDLLLGIAAEAEALAPDLPSDMAENHDYYAHGKPRP
jgi:hypothetical protein